MKHSIFHPVRPGALAASLMLLVVSTSYADNRAQQCLDDYLKSPAARTCLGAQNNSVNIFINRAGKCVIADTCPSKNGVSIRSSIAADMNQVHELQNCNGQLC